MCKWTKLGGSLFDTRCRMVLAAVCSLVLSQAAWAGSQSHGVSIGKSCEQNPCVGDLSDCTIEVGHDDDFGDTLEIIEAFDVVDPDGDAVRVPPVSGNLPIVGVSGNTTCTVGGSLPCLVCAGGASCGGGAPISDEPGVVIFRQNTYIIEADDPNPLEDQGNVRLRDLCDGCGAPPCAGCSGVTNRLQFTAATELLTCDDENSCTTDTCTNSACTFTPDCLTAADCPDDGNACTTEICTPAGCCDRTPDCTTAAGCDDENACTTDTCVNSCCVHTPDCTNAADCPDDGNTCTTETCSALGCCGRTPDCTVAADCDDENTCTTDACTNSCCVNTPDCTTAADCDDENECTTDSCASGCCVNTPDCTTAADCSDDGNACTRETCTDGCCGRTTVVCTDTDPCTDAVCNEKTGVCEFPATEPPPEGCAEFAGCTPGFWKQPHHAQYWPAPYLPTNRVNTVFGVTSTGNPTLLQALETGGGGEKAFLRHAVSALLNSASGEVEYFYSTAQVIAMVQAAYASGDFATAHSNFARQNELGCTVDKSGDARLGEQRGGGKK